MPRVLLAALVGVVGLGCSVSVVLDDRACGAGHPCVQGYQCVEERCRDEGSLVPCALSTGCPDHQLCAPIGFCVPAPRDAGGESDGGLVDAGALDAGESDGGLVDAGGLVDVDAGALDAGAMGDGGSTTWWGPTFAKRAPLWLQHGVLGEDVAGVPVRVRLPPTVVAASTISDLRFVGDDGALLPHEVDGDAPDGSGFLDVWVSAPTLSTGAPTTRLWVYFDDALANSAQNPAALWQPYTNVWHLSDDFSDSAVAALDGTGAGPAFAAGRIGSAAAFDGVDDWVDLGGGATAAGVDYLRLCMYFELTSTADVPNMNLVSLGAAAPLAPAVSRAEVSVIPTGLSIVAKAPDDGTSRSYDAVYPLTTTWTWFCGAADYAGDRLSIYADGSVVGSVSASFAATTTDSSFSQAAALGAEDTGANDFFAGLLDEVRVSSVRQTSTWLAVEHAAMEPSFAVLGTIESRSP